MRILSVVAVMSMLIAAGARAETTNNLSEAEIQGRQLAQQLLEQSPFTNSLQTGVLKIRDSKGITTNIQVICSVVVTPTNWLSVYQAVLSDKSTEQLIVLHKGDLPNVYSHMASHGEQPEFVSSNTTMPFAGSDFSVGDLGLQFFHWPEQKILPNPTSLKRGRSYKLLESTNPDPATNGYSRVLTWVDKETGGILQAEAYDAQGKLLKEFSPKSFKKVNGQWQLQEMEIDNVQTGSRTRLEFDLPK